MRILSVLTLAAASVFAQPDTWDLVRGIRLGQTTHVHTQDGRRYSGAFASTTGTSVVIHERSADQSVEKTQIQKISVRKSSKRWRNAAIGAGIGAGLGATLGSLPCKDTPSTYFGCFNGPRVAGVAAAVFGLVGAGIGALIPGYETVYRAPRK